MQNRYSLSDRGSEDVLDCEQHKIGSIPWFPLAAGRLSGPSSPAGHAAVKANATPSQVALAWLLWRSPIMLPILGTAKVQHLEENIAAAGLKLDEAEWNNLRMSASASRRSSALDSSVRKAYSVPHGSIRTKSSGRQGH